MAAVRRQDFVPNASEWEVVSDRPLPIGHGQTISQPSLVDYMTDCLNIEGGDRVLEVGTGSGYQAAVLADRGAEVFSVEIIESLAREARERLEQLGFHRVHVRHADGYAGWPEHAPFNAIVVTAAAEQVPEPLLAQLAEGGHMIIPIGRSDGVQKLHLIERLEGKTKSTELMSVRFVPFTRGTR